ncbi:MAG TPA: nucleotide exchange factor GrpE [Streptosporangiaceae bacterium]|nr:nucleotide exchange factor GrpE [Streptosporangiaceae bacterium]
MPASEETGSGPVIHDHRRIDPVTGQVRGRHAASKPAGTTGAGRPADGSGPDGPTDSAGSTGSTGSEDGMEAQETAEEVLEGILEEPPADRQAGQAGQADRQADAEARLAERTADLQRLQAEYANYRKRVDRDRAAVREQAVASTLAGLLPVLDAIDQAREHGELSGGFKSVADSLQAALGRLGLVVYGEKGDLFDPKIHEALTHTFSPDVAEDTCVEILQPGYKVGDRILRPARVAVAEPATGPDGASNETEWSTDEEN